MPPNGHGKCATPDSEKLLIEPLAIRLGEQTTLAKSLVTPKGEGGKVSLREFYVKLWLVMLAIGMALTAPIAQGEYGDVVLNKQAEKEGMRPVVFPHWFHRLRFTCNVCHNENGFKMRAGSNDITMAGIVDGKFCGMCHNNEIAWSPEYCNRCHSGLPGLESGFYGSQLPEGPRSGAARRH